MKKPKIIVFVLCLFASLSGSIAQSQMDSVRALGEVVIEQSRLGDYVIAPYQLPLDSGALALASNGSLTDLLRKQGLGHIRSYGPGGLATPSFRGSGSSHTAVLWNGINLVSPLSGQLDLSLVPAGLFDDASIQTGGSTSLSGNGTIGANIHLNNNVNLGEGLRITAASHWGSFGAQYYLVGAELSNQRFGMSAKVFSNSAQNDFEFTNRSLFRPERQRREHSAFEQKGMLQQVHWRTAGAGTFSVKLWYQKSFYEVPNPVSVRRPGQATEENVFYRALAGWNFFREHFDLHYQGAFIRHDLHYVDPVIDENSQNRYNSIIHNFESNFRLGEQSQLTSGVHYTWEEGVAENFGASAPLRNRLALFAAVKSQPFEKWMFAFSARAEFVDGAVAPLSPALSVKRKVGARLSVFSNISRNYRIPTFNDLYWRGAGARGNPFLRTEISLSAEGGAEYRWQNLFVKAIVFTNHVDNWILWNEVQIDSGPSSGRVWTPLNVKKVWSRGAEAQAKFSKKIGAFQTSVAAQYSFTKSTNESIYANGNVSEKGKQLMLTPVHEGSVTLESKWRDLSLRIISTYTGQQFNDSDNSPYNIVDDYAIANVWLTRRLSFKRLTVVCIAEINNAFNVEYVARPGYPLPGRNYKAGFQFNFNKPPKL